MTSTSNSTSASTSTSTSASASTSSTASMKTESGSGDVKDVKTLSADDSLSGTGNGNGNGKEDNSLGENGKSSKGRESERGRSKSRSRSRSRGRSKKARDGSGSGGGNRKDSSRRQNRSNSPDNGDGDDHEEEGEKKKKKKRKLDDDDDDGDDDDEQQEASTSREKESKRKSKSRRRSIGRSRGRDRSRSKKQNRSRSRSRSRSRGRSRSRSNRNRRDGSRKREKNRERNRERGDRQRRSVSASAGSVDSNQNLTREEMKEKKEMEALTRDARTVFVSQLQVKATERDVKRFFKTNCAVKDVVLIKDKRTGRSKGNAYVEVKRLDDVKKALELDSIPFVFSNGKTGFPIKVKPSEAEKNFAHQVEKRTKRHDSYGANSAGSRTNASTSASSHSDGASSLPGTNIEDSNGKDKVKGKGSTNDSDSFTRIYVGNLHPTLTVEYLNELCSPFGDIVSAQLQVDPVTNVSRGFAFVKFATHESAKKAVEMLQDKEVSGMKLKLNSAKDLSSRSSLSVPTSQQNLANQQQQNQQQQQQQQQVQQFQQFQHFRQFQQVNPLPQGTSQQTSASEQNTATSQMQPQQQPGQQQQQPEQQPEQQQGHQPGHTNNAKEKVAEDNVSSNWRLDDDGGGIAGRRGGGSGVSMNASKRMEIMSKLAGGALKDAAATYSGATSNIPVNSQPPREVAGPITGEPSRYLRLSNMFDPASETEVGWEHDIADETKQECEKHGGKVIQCIVDKHSKEGYVYLEFESQSGSTQAATALHGRWFAARIIRAHYLADDSEMKNAERLM